MSKNVHLVLIILIRQGKFVLSFLDFYLIFCDFFRFGGIFKKKETAPDRAEAQPSQPAHPRRLPRAHDAAAARVPLVAAPPCPFPKAAPPSLNTQPPTTTTTRHRRRVAPPRRRRRVSPDRRGSRCRLFLKENRFGFFRKTLVHFLDRFAGFSRFPLICRAR